MKSFLAAMTVLGLLTWSAAADAITRDAMIETAEAYAAHTWSASWSNYTASCKAAYTSLYIDYYGVGAQQGVAYDWGGFDSLSGFDAKIAEGKGAGSHPNDGVLSCTTGVDCSGFVSRCWALSTKKGTATFHTVSYEIPAAEVLKGDAYNKPNSHMRMWHYQAADGQPVVYEAAGGAVRKAWHNTGITWSGLSGYTPIRYDFVTDGGGPVAGSKDAPIVVDSFPYHHDYTTSLTAPGSFDVYSCAPNTGEMGPEVVYELHLPEPGEITASVSDGVGVDIDLHVLTALDPDACLARDDKLVGPIGVNGGTTWLIADSWSNDSGTAYPGSYSLDITFVPAPVDEASEPAEPEAPAPPSDSCLGFCGEQAPSGCWCDTACVTAGDCCDDACALCGTCNASCVGICGQVTESGCGCDVACVATGDCCADACTLCGACDTSCDGDCGEQADPTSCWCDDACVTAGDCCQDACEVCGACPVPPPPSDRNTQDGESGAAGENSAVEEDDEAHDLPRAPAPGGSERAPSGSSGIRWSPAPSPGSAPHARGGCRHAASAPPGGLTGGLLLLLFWGMRRRCRTS